MTVPETLLIFVGIPVAVVVLGCLAVVGPSMVRKQNRYRPTKGWPYEPAWYLPHKAVPSHGTVAAIEGRTQKALTGETPAPRPLGGASGEW